MPAPEGHLRLPDVRMRGFTLEANAGRPRTRCERHVTGDGLPLTVTELSVSIEYALKGTTQRATFQFGGLPLGEQMIDYLCEEAEDCAGGTTRRRAQDLAVLGTWMREVGVADLDARTYRAFLRWMKVARRDDGAERFGPDALQNAAGTVAAFYEFGLAEDFPGWTVADLDAMVDCRSSELRGSGHRALQRSIDRAVSLEQYEQLLRALRLELESCREVLARGRSQPGPPLGVGRPDPDPFVVFALYAALLHGLRAEELNVLDVTDLDVQRKVIRAHAPDKAERELPVSDVLLEAFELCLAWSEVARREPGQRRALVYVATIPRRAVVQVTASNLNHRTLKQFYAKYHRLRIDGRPVLHAPLDAATPFWCDYRKLRNAAITRWAEREESLAVVKELAGHRRSATTGRYYTHLHRADHRKKMAVALGPEAQVLAATVRNPVTLGIPAEVAVLAREGLVTEYGGCGSAQGCARAEHCLACELVIIQVSKRTNIERELAAQERRAARLENEGFLRDAENARRLASLAKGHLERIDDFLRRTA